MIVTKVVDIQKVEVVKYLVHFTTLTFEAIKTKVVVNQTS